MAMSNQQNSKTTDDVPAELIESWKKALAELAEEAHNDTIRNCIRIYNPEKPTKHNIKVLKSSCRKDTILETLNFLMKSNQNLNKDEAAEKMCLKIQSYFPDICPVCEKSYSVKYQDNPLMHCGSCGQEVHQPCYLKLLKSMNLLDKNKELKDLIHKIPGMYYLCSPCQEKMINFPHATPKTANTTNISLLAEQTHNPISSPNDISELSNLTPRRSLPSTPRNRSLPSIPLTPTVLLHDAPSKNQGDVYLGRTEFMKKKFQRDLENNATFMSENTTSQSLKDKEAPQSSKDGETFHQKTNETFHQKADGCANCRFYMKGKCKHGIRGKNCQYNHPKACTKLMKYGNKASKGCSAGSKCADFHPRMCSSSIKTGTCFNNMCPFAHVKGTKRKPDVSKDNPSNMHQSSDFLKVLDNFRLQIISFINESLQPRPYNPPPLQTFPTRHPTQTMFQLPNQISQNHQTTRPLQ